jgi:hypothetical protein
MYYRVAIHRPAEHLDQSLSWQWTSTPLSSLETLVQFLRRYGAVGLDRLQVFSSSSRQGLQEQLIQENKGPLSTSVTAVHFLHERLIHSLEGTQATPVREATANQQMAAPAVSTHPWGKIRGWEGNGLVGSGMSALERKRLELELGPGGDHDVPYRFVLPALMPPVLAWMRLLACVQRGELQREVFSVGNHTGHVASRFATRLSTSIQSKVSGIAEKGNPV